jgi:hypothetical protein
LRPCPFRRGFSGFPAIVGERDAASPSAPVAGAAEASSDEEVLESLPLPSTAFIFSVGAPKSSFRKRAIVVFLSSTNSAMVP